MAWSKLLHFLAVILGIIGFLALVGAWIAGDGEFLGFEQAHLFSDANSLLLLAILFALGTLIHQNLEKAQY